MSNFNGYYMKIGNCRFQNPAISREGFKVLPKLVMVTDEQRVASGKLILKELPHKPVKLDVTFPVMTPEQFRTYFNAIDSMTLNIEFYDDSTDSYRTGVFYHTDIQYLPVIYGGQRMIKLENIKFIEY